jgi:hypothetical protein
LLETDQHFRRCTNIDGGWGYTPMARMPGVPAAGQVMPGMGSTPAMTCAGLLGVGAGYGAVNDISYGGGKKPGRPGATRPQDPSKDRVVVDAMRLLGAWIDVMAQGGKAPQINVANGKFYYFLWSLERAAVAYDVEKFGKTDWYDWGADILLANQGRDGSWSNGGFVGPPDTCFALLFLRRANLAKDLSRALKSQMKEGLQTALRQGGIGGGSLVRARKPFFDGQSAEDRHGTEVDAEAAKLGKQLAAAGADEQEALLRKLRDGKGAAYTEALAAAIPGLQGEALKKAREALAERLAHMTPETLSVKLEDDSAEVRRAAALAVAMKEDKVHTEKLIELLSDREATVGRAAHAALKSLTGQDFGPAKDASPEERARAILDWKQWYRKQRQEEK